MELVEGLDAAVAARADRAFTFLERLVGADSTVGREAAAQEIFGEEMQRLGLEVTPLAIPEAITDDPLAGVPQCSYEGRQNALATTASGDLAVLFNGHIDVVPADPAGWTGSPWTARRRDGWLYGRGAGDMKGGFAMAALALDALRAVAPEVLEMPVGFLSVIEEECTGNGTLAGLRAGVVADLVVLPEPTDLGLLIGGVGIVWVDVVLRGQGGHAESANRLEHVVEVAARLIPALVDLGRRTAKDELDPVFAEVEEPYNINVGMVQAGDWRSTVTSSATLGVRFGHPRSWDTARAIGEIEAVVADVCEGSGVTATVHPVGFRAEGYALDPADPLVGLLARAHAAAHGSPPESFVLGSTTDARYYLNDARVPALCYGPVARHIHGTDEAVELDSIVRGARTLAVFLAHVAAARGGHDG